MTMASSNVSAVTVEANEFPQLSRRFGVRGVPQTVVDHEGIFTGAMPEEMYVGRILELAGVGADEEEPPAEA
jgi:predicted DsbA family dithiol-disulfide isomerase